MMPKGMKKGMSMGRNTKGNRGLGNKGKTSSSTNYSSGMPKSKYLGDGKGDSGMGKSAKGSMKKSMSY